MPTSDMRPAMATIPPRYQPLQLLGQGGMGEVWSVRCSESGETLALKICLNPDETGRLLFRHEFWAMTTLRHPNLVPALEQGETIEGSPYFTMPVISGADVQGVVPEEQVRAWLPGLLSALDFLHQRGFVHGDLKPENIRLLDDGGVKLMDLGLLERTGRTRKISGTLAYVPPETILGKAIDGRSDFYTLGAVLFELLTGNPPFDHPETDALLRAHVSQTPPLLRQKNPAVSAEMERVVNTLLEKDPANRLMSGSAILRALGLEAASDEAAILWSPPLVGREDLQHQLETWAVAPKVTRTLLALQGSAGLGRSRLLEELRAYARLENEICLLTAAQGSGASPYLGFSDAVKQLWSLSEPTVRDRVAPFLSSVLPGLSTCAAPVLDGPAERARLFDAIASLAQSLHARILWCIDDFDQLDADSLELFDFLLKRGEVHGWRWLIAGTNFDESRVTSEARLSLEPLSTEQISTMLQGMLGGNVPDAVLAQTVRLTEGIPASVTLLLQHWIQQGSLQKRRGNWVVAHEGDLAVNLQALGISGLPLASLPPSVQDTLLNAALLGESGTLADLASFSQVTDEVLFETIAALQDRDILECKDGKYRFLRPAQATNVMAKLDAPTRESHQGRIAAFLSERYPLSDCVSRQDLGRMLTVAGHWVSANRQAAAFSWVEAATRLCLARGTTAQVIPLVERLLQAPDLAPDTRMTLAGLEVYVLRHQGQLDVAISRYTDGLLKQLAAQGDHAVAEHMITYSTMLQQKARYGEAEAASREGIERARACNDWPTVVRGLFALARMSLFRGETNLAMRQLEEAIDMARTQGLPAALPPMLSLAGYLLAEKDNAQIPEALAMLNEGLKLARDADNLMDAAEALNNLGNVLLTRGRYRTAKHYFDEYLLLCDRMAFPSEQTFAHLNIAGTALELGHFTDAAYHLDIALKLCQNTGRRFPEAFARVLQGMLKVSVGEGSQGLALIASGIQIAREISNRYLEEQALPYQAEAALLTGQVDWAEALITGIEQNSAESPEASQSIRLTRIKAGIQAFRQPALSLAEHEETAATGSHVHGLTAHCLRWAGCAALRLGHSARAERLWRQARTMAETEGLTGLMLELDLLQAQAAEEQGAYGRALTSLERAARGVEASGARATGEWIELMQMNLPGAEAQQRQALQRTLLARFNRLPEESRAQVLQLTCRDRMLTQEAMVDTSVRATQLASLLLELSKSATPEEVAPRALEIVLRNLGGIGAQMLIFKDSRVLHTHRHGTLSEATKKTMVRVGQEAQASMLEGITEINEPGGGEGSFLIAVPIKAGEEIHVWLLNVTNPSGLDIQGVMKTLHYIGQQSIHLWALFARKQPTPSPPVGTAPVLEAAKAALSKPNPAARLAALAQASLTIFKAKRVLWLTMTGRSVRCEFAFDRDEGLVNPEWQMFTKGIARNVLRENASVFLDAMHDGPQQQRASIRALDLHYILAAPVVHQGQTLGALYFDLGDHLPAKDEAIQTLELLTSVWSGVADDIADYRAQELNG